MSYRNPNTSQGSEDFHKDSISEADFSGELTEEKSKRKETKFEKKFLFKKDSKDKGYASLAGDANQDSVFLVNSKTSKKPKADTKITSLSVFKKSFKDEKRLKNIKESKEETKRIKKLKERTGIHGKDRQKENLFGNHLENAVRSFPSNDGVKVPAPIRICLDIIEQKGVDSELYRRSVNKSNLESLCEVINSNKIETRLDELNAEPALACAVVKKFLRDLKSPVISDEVLSVIEKCDSNISDKDTKVQFLKKQIEKIPQPNLDTFTYLVMHFYRILYKSELNKIEIGIFVQKFQPIFRIRERLFKFMISHADLLFSEYRFKKYRIKPNEEAMARFSSMPDNVEDLEQEISKQEVYLSKLHSKIANEEHSSDKTLQEQLSEELWALQRYVTSLKRKVKKLKIEHKNIEADQLNKLKEMQSSREVESGSKTQKTAEEDPHRLLNPVELYNRELNLTCENSVLIESIQSLFERLNQEKVLTAEFQQKIFNLSRNMDMPGVDTSKLSVQELQDKEQLIINENKLLEERINLINKRINLEKEKIFELKLNIQLKTIPNLTGDQLVALSTNQLDMHLSGKMNLPDSKELIMTKL